MIDTAQRATENTVTELLRIMENIRKVTTDTKGAVYVGLEACWFDLEKVCQQNMIDITGTIRRMDIELKEAQNIRAAEK